MYVYNGLPYELIYVKGDVKSWGNLRQVALG